MERARNKYTTEELAAFRLGLTLGVASLLPLEEFLLFADSRPDYFVQTLLDKQFDF